MSNIKLFDCFCVSIFAGLYNNFPLKYDFDVYTATAKCNEDISLLERSMILYATVEWLRDEGFIIYSEIDKRECKIKGAILTVKGLTILNNPPKALKAKDTIGDKLKEAVANGVTDVAVGLVKQIIGAN